MPALLALAFLAVPFLELFVIVQAAGEIGVLNTLALLVVISVAGAWLCKREGLAVLRRVQHALARGEMPQAHLVDGGLILLAGALLVTPGFLTDVLALLLLVPPTRAVARGVVLAQLRRRIVVSRLGAGTGPRPGPGPSPGRPRDGVYDVWGEETPRPSGPPSIDRP